MAAISSKNMRVIEVSNIIDTSSAKWSALADKCTGIFSCLIPFDCCCYCCVAQPEFLSFNAEQIFETSPLERLTRHETRRLLEGEPDGSVILRRTEKRFIAIGYKRREQIYHFTAERSPNISQLDFVKRALNVHGCVLSSEAESLVQRILAVDPNTPLLEIQPRGDETEVTQPSNDGTEHLPAVPEPSQPDPANVETQPPEDKTAAALTETGDDGQENTPPLPEPSIANEVASPPVSPPERRVQFDVPEDAPERKAVGCQIPSWIFILGDGHTIDLRKVEVFRPLKYGDVVLPEHGTTKRMLQNREKGTILVRRSSSRDHVVIARKGASGVVQHKMPLTTGHSLAKIVQNGLKKCQLNVNKDTKAYLEKVLSTSPIDRRLDEKYPLRPCGKTVCRVVEGLGNRGRLLYLTPNKFALLLNHFRPTSPIKKEDLPRLTLHEGSDMLSGQRVGTFLVRRSATHSDQVVVVIVKEEKILHFRCTVDGDNLRKTVVRCLKGEGIELSQRMRELFFSPPVKEDESEAVREQRSDSTASSSTSVEIVREGESQIKSGTLSREGSGRGPGRPVRIAPHVAHTKEEVVTEMESVTYTAVDTPSHTKYSEIIGTISDEAHREYLSLPTMSAEQAEALVKEDLTGTGYVLRQEENGGIGFTWKIGGNVAHSTLTRGREDLTKFIFDFEEKTIEEVVAGIGEKLSATHDLTADFKEKYGRLPEISDYEANERLSAHIKEYEGCKDCYLLRQTRERALGVSYCTGEAIYHFELEPSRGTFGTFVALTPRGREYECTIEEAHTLLKREFGAHYDDLHLDRATSSSSDEAAAATP